MKIRKLAVVLFSATLVFTPVKVHGNENVNRFDDWKESAIISPEAGELKAAGPIEVRFNELDLEGINIDHYDLYLDGEDIPADVIDSGEETVGEIYTTEVAVHNVQVVAVTDTKYEISSNARQFLVSKKGMSVDNKPGQVEYPVEDMKASWCYNWSTEPYEFDSTNNFIPMIWNGATVDWLSSDEAKNYDTVLGFNEPDLEGQAEMTVEEAVKYHKNFRDSGLRVGSAVIAHDNDWFDSYMEAIDYDVDFIPMHIYFAYPDAGQVQWVLDQINTTYEKYHKPIWITEIAFASNDPGWTGLVSGSGMQSQVNDSMKILIEALDELSYVERYAWFSFDTLHTYGGVSSLYETNDGTKLEKGQLTELGQIYKTLGNPNVGENDLADIPVEDRAYYVDLDNIMGKLEAVMNSNEYVITDSLKELYQQGLNIDRTYGSLNQRSF